jgi:hypothetical protein
MSRRHAYWFGAGGDVIAGRSPDLEAGTEWYWRDRQSGQIAGVGSIAGERNPTTGLWEPRVRSTDRGWPALCDYFGPHMLGAATREHCGAMIERALARTSV